MVMKELLNSPANAAIAITAAAVMPINTLKHYSFTLQIRKVCA